MTATIVRGGTVVTAGSPPESRDVAVEDGRIVAEAEREDSAAVLDATAHLVVPGLVNAHDHLRSLLPSTRRADNSTLTDLVDAAQLAAAAATPYDYAALTALAAARQLLSGVVATVDHVYPLHTTDLLKALVTAYAEVGLRAYLAFGLMTSGPREIVDDIEIQIRRAESIADDLVPADQLYLAPVSLRQTSVDGYRAAVAAADRTGLNLYTHIAESSDEVARCEAEHGLRPIELLARLGFLRPGTVLVHCVHLSEREIELLAENSVAVVYCPSNHLRLAKGFAPVTTMRSAGVRVCLGVDGMTDLFTEMRQAVYAQGFAEGRPGALTTTAAFEMASSEARAALRDRSSGRLIAGDRADLITVRTDNPMSAPLVDPVQMLVHRASGSDVRDVMVDGRIVVRGGQLMQADSAELIARARFVTRELARRTGREVAEDWTW